MKYRLIEKAYPSVSITAPVNTEALDLGAAGCDSIVYVMTLSAPSSPNTANITLQGSLDGTNWVADGSAVNVTTAASYTVSKDRPLYRYYRLAYAIASGSYTSVLKVLAKGDKE